MELSEIQKAVAAFQEKLQAGQKVVPIEEELPPVVGGPKKAKPVTPQPQPEPVEAPPLMTPCLNKTFKDMIKALEPGYIGNVSGKPFLVEFMDTQITECG